MTVKIPRGYTPLREALNLPSCPCEHCTGGTVHLDNGRSFPCVYCDGTGEYEPEEIQLARRKLALVICKDCEGSKMQTCPGCFDSDPAECSTCDGFAIIQCVGCDGFGYLFVDERSEQEQERGLPAWAIAYAKGLIDEYGS